MELSRTTSPYFSRWVKTHGADLKAAVTTIKNRNFKKLGELAERSCLKMHAVAMTSKPPLLYWSGATLECAKKIRELRKSGVPVFFSIDAGPQLKAFCLPESSQVVRETLEQVPGVLRVISSELGEGARIVE
jgi:diphosphomevalonate decarboxylase